MQIVSDMYSDPDKWKGGKLGRNVRRIDRKNSNHHQTEKLSILKLVYRAESRGVITVAKFLLWLLLLVFCWPLAIAALVLYPIVWLLMLPFRLVGITVDALFQFIKGLFLLPARVLRGN